MKTANSSKATQAKMRMRRRSSSATPVTNSSKERVTPSTNAAGVMKLRLKASRYSLITKEVPTGASNFTNPENMNTSPTIRRQKRAEPFIVSS